jgi:AcrR family transcriptional regulator
MLQAIGVVMDLGQRAALGRRPRRGCRRPTCRRGRSFALFARRPQSWWRPYSPSTLTIIDCLVYYDWVPRPERHPVDKLLDVSRDLVLSDGARAVTVDRIVAVSGAPKGSVYHRFSTVNDLLATMWLRGVRRSQARFLEALDAEGDPIEAAVAAGLAIHDFAADEPADARLLAALRREDLVAEVTDPALAVALQRVNDELRSAMTALARRLYGRATRDAIERATCAVIDLPQGAIRRHLVQGVAVPRGVRPQLAAAIRAALRHPPNSTD